MGIYIDISSFDSKTTSKTILPKIKTFKSEIICKMADSYIFFFEELISFIPDSTCIVSYHLHEHKYIASFKDNFYISYCSQSLDTANNWATSSIGD